MFSDKPPLKFGVSLDRPVCPKCKVCFGREGVESQFFDCPVCHHDLTLEVAQAERPKNAEGLSGSELHAPKYLTGRSQGTHRHGGEVR